MNWKPHSRVAQSAEKVVAASPPTVTTFAVARRPRPPPVARYLL